MRVIRIRSKRRILILFLTILDEVIADVFSDEGNKEWRKGEYNYAIICYTEGIDVNCKDENINTILFTNRAAAHFLLGKSVSFWGVVLFSTVAL